MKLNSLHDLYIDQLKDLYSAEKQLTKALPKMAKAAHSPKLKQAFDTHLRQTEQQMTRLEEIMQRHDANPGRKVCKGMEGLIAEGEEVIEEGKDPMPPTRPSSLRRSAWSTTRSPATGRCALTPA